MYFHSCIHSSNYLFTDIYTYIIICISGRLHTESKNSGRSASGRLGAILSTAGSHRHDRAAGVGNPVLHAEAAL